MSGKKYPSDEFKSREDEFIVDDNYDILFDLINSDSELSRKINEGPDEYEDIYSSSQSVRDSYEDVYSSSANLSDDFSDVFSSVKNQNKDDAFSDSPRDVYFGRTGGKIPENDDVYIGKGRTSKAQNISNTDEFQVNAVSVSERPEKKTVNEDEISDFDARRNKGGRGSKKPVGALVVAVILALVIGLGGIFFSAANGIVGEFIEAEPIEHIEDVDSLVSDKSVRNILLIGADKEKGGASRSDSIMIASVNKKTGRITVCSILRDTHLDIPGKRESKVNAAYAWGGANLLIQTIEQNFGIKIDDYATVNFEMFTALVDGLGGIEVEVTENEADYINNRHNYKKEEKPDHFESGKSVQLNGYQALWYSRIRKLDSDFMRTERQRKVISAIVSKVKTQLTPFGVFGLVNTAKSVAPYIETTLSTSDFISLALSLASCASKSGLDMDKLLVSQKIPFDETWWYSSEWDGSSISIDLEENKQLLYDLLYGDYEITEDESTEG